MNDVGAFDAFPSMIEYKSEELVVRHVMASIDRLLPSDRDRKLKQQSTQILNYYTVDQLQQQFGFVIEILFQNFTIWELKSIWVNYFRSSGRNC